MSDDQDANIQVKSISARPIVKRTKVTTANKRVTKKARKKGDTSKRYTDAQKRDILAFVDKHGYGGMTQANKKYGVSYLAISRWRDEMGIGKVKITKEKTNGHNPDYQKIAEEIKRKVLQGIQEAISNW
jgi:hypothetical protein